MRRPPDLPVPEIVDRGLVLHLYLGGDAIQGSVLFGEPDVLVHTYVQQMMAGLLAFDEADLAGRRAMQLGLGADSITRFCLNVLRLRTVAVEINPLVIEVCGGVLALPHRHPRLRVVHGDARKVVRRSEWRGAIDLLHVDMYEGDADAPVDDSVGFLAACRDCLSPQGVMTMNVFGLRSDSDATAARIAEVFGRDRVFTLPSDAISNVVVVAARPSLPPPGVLEARAQCIEQRWGLPATTWLQQLTPLPPHERSTTGRQGCG